MTSLGSTTSLPFTVLKVCLSLANGAGNAKESPPLEGFIARFLNKDNVPTSPLRNPPGRLYVITSYRLSTSQHSRTTPHHQQTMNGGAFSHPSTRGRGAGGPLPGSPFAHHPSFRGSNHERGRGSSSSRGRGRGAPYAAPPPQGQPQDIPLHPFIPGSNLNHLPAHMPPHLVNPNLITQQPGPQTHHMVFNAHKRGWVSVPINGVPKSFGSHCCWEWCGDFNTCSCDCCREKVLGCCCLPCCLCVCGDTKKDEALSDVPKWVWFVLALFVVVVICVVTPVVVKEVALKNANADKSVRPCKQGLCVGNPFNDPSNF